MTLDEAQKKATDQFNELINIGEVKMDSTLIVVVYEDKTTELPPAAIFNPEINKELKAQKGEVFVCTLDSDGPNVSHLSLS